MEPIHSIQQHVAAYFGFCRLIDTDLFVRQRGQPPLSFTILLVFPVLTYEAGLLTITNAVLIHSTNAAILEYRDVETNGNANINCRSGTVSFWFKADWNSGTASGSDGTVDRAGQLQSGLYQWVVGVDTLIPPDAA